MKNDTQSLIEQGLNLIQQALSIFDADMRLVLTNKRFSDMFGIPVELSKPGTTFEEINYFLARRGEFGPGDPKALAEDRIERARKFEPHYFERTRPNGRRISVEGNPLSEGGWVAIYSDITETWQNEQVLKARSDDLSDKLLRRTGLLSETNRALEASNRALNKTKSDLQRSEERLRTIIGAMPAHIAYLDRTLTYQFSNNRFNDVTGLNREDLTGKHITQAFPPAVLAQLKPQLDAALVGEHQNFTYIVQLADDVVETVRTTALPEVDTNGDVTGAFVLSINVSAEVAANEMQLHAKRMEMTAQLTSGLAHDFSNILTVILGNLQRIGKADADAQEDLIQSTEQAARRGTRIIDNLMALLYRQHLDEKYTNVSKLLRDLMRLFNASLPKTIVLSAELGDEDIWAHIDESAWQNAFLNLLFNARDAIETHVGEGTISVSLSRLGDDDDELGANEQGGIQLKVSDTGSGFSEEAIANATQPFFTTKPQGKGSGLGLAMVHTFVEQSGGKLFLKNVPNSGAEVKFWMPLSSDSEQSSENKVDNGEMLPTSNQQLVLLVDDDAEMRAIMREHLANMNLLVLEASNAAEALTLVEQVPDISILISDIVMPGNSNGLSLAKLAHQLRRDISILLVSGLPYHDETFRCAKKEFDVLHKPFDETTFQDAVRKTVGMTLS